MREDKITIAASILNSNFFCLDKEIEKVKNAGINMLHLDVMDGSFVPNITIGTPIIKAIRENTKLFLDTHLMIREPEKHIDSFIGSGADSITVHAEECTHLDRTLNYIRGTKIKTAVALNPSTPLCFIENVLGLVDMVLIMTVNPGFGGQNFIEGMIYKIRNLKNMIDEHNRLTGYSKKINIQVDGGIGLKTASLVVEAGADILVIGTSFFKSKNPSKLVEEIKACSYKT